METLKKIFKKFTNNSKLPKAKNITHISIFGFADAKPDSQLYQEAYQVAFILAKAGYVVVDGGGPGVMEAASKGAKAGGGRVIGITFYPKDATNFEGRDFNNPIDTEIQTKNYVERTVSLLKEGQVYIVFNGASGTLSEFAMAWGTARIYLGHHKPLILYGKFWKRIIQALKENLMIRPGEDRVFKIASTPEEVLKDIAQFEKEIESGKHKHLKASKEESAFTI